MWRPNKKYSHIQVIGLSEHNKGSNRMFMLGRLQGWIKNHLLMLSLRILIS